MKTLESFVREAAEAPPETPPKDVLEGFVIQQVEMKGFMRYLHRTEPPISFPWKFTVITGPTGAGKTSILDAITFALYKRTTRTDIQGIKISDICLNGGYVKVTFHQGGFLYGVTRGFTSTGTPYLDLKMDGKSLHGTIPEIERMVEDIVGLDYDGFRNSTFVRQEEMKELGAESPAARLEIFQKLFRLETFQKALELTKEMADELEAKMRERDAEITARRESVGRLPPLREDLTGMQKEVSMERRRLDEIEIQVAQEDAELKELEKRHEDYLRMSTRRQELGKTIVDIEGKLNKKLEEGAKSRELRSKIGELQRETKDYDRIEEEGELLKDKQQKFTLLMKDKESVLASLEGLEGERRRRVEELDRRLRQEEVRIERLSTDLSTHEAFDALRKDGALEERLARIEREVEWLSDRQEILATIREEEGEARRQLPIVKQMVSKINKDTFVVSEIREQIDRIKDSLSVERARFEEEIAKVKAKLEEIERRIHSVGYGEDERKRLSDIRSLMSALRAKRDELQKAKERLDLIGDVTKVVQELEGQRSRLQDELKELDAELKNLAPHEEGYAVARSQLEELRARRESLLKAIHEKEGEIRNIKKQMAELEEEEKRIGQMEAELQGMRQRSEVLSILKEGVFHKKGVVMYAVNQLLPLLEVETSRNLADLTDGRLGKVKLETHEEARGYGIKILVEGVDGSWHDVGEFSGGERTQINAALRFAIARELASMPQVGRTYGRMKTLFIDEGDLGSLDTESSRDLFVNKLFNMGEFFDKIILITHLTEVADKFPGRIRVFMSPEQESRIEVVS